MANIVIDRPNLLDTMSFRLLVERSVLQEDIKVSLPVTVLLSQGEDDATRLSASVREALNRFIGADWALANIQRGFEATGFERLTLTAHARVPVDENRNLHDRAVAASRPGLMLSSPTVSYALPTKKISAILEDLRLEALADVGRQLPILSQTIGRDWRIGHVQFGDDPQSDYRLTPKGARRGTGFDDDGEGLAGSERISLAVDVTLKASVA